MVSLQSIIFASGLCTHVIVYFFDGKITRFLDFFLIVILINTVSFFLKFYFSSHFFLKLVLLNAWSICFPQQCYVLFWWKTLRVKVLWQPCVSVLCTLFCGLQSGIYNPSFLLNALSWPLMFQSLQLHVMLFVDSSLNSICLSASGAFSLLWARIFFSCVFYPFLVVFWILCHLYSARPLFNLCRVLSAFLMFCKFWLLCQRRIFVSSNPLFLSGWQS